MKCHLLNAVFALGIVASLSSIQAAAQDVTPPMDMSWAIQTQKDLAQKSPTETTDSTSMTSAQRAAYDYMMKLRELMKHTESLPPASVPDTSPRATEKQNPAVDPTEPGKSHAERRPAIDGWDSRALRGCYQVTDSESKQIWICH